MASKAAEYKARDVAKAVSKATGRDVDSKRVRAWVRDHVPAFDDDGYTAHVYSAAQFRSIVAGMTAARKAGRPRAAIEGRAGTPRTARKAATPRNVAQDGKRTTRPPVPPMSGDSATDGDA